MVKERLGLLRTKRRNERARSKGEGEDLAEEMDEMRRGKSGAT
jgi:hypothetical protein